jgi:hypothetical protein
MTAEILQFSVTERPRDWRKDECSHAGVYVNEMEWKVTCKKCGKEVDPIAYLVFVSREAKSNSWQLGELQKEVEATKAKLRCKCEHCEKMTRISR